MVEPVSDVSGSCLNLGDDAGVNFFTCQGDYALPRRYKTTLYTDDMVALH